MATLPNEVADVILNEIRLYNFTRSENKDIYSLVSSIDIYESLTNNTLSADIALSEGVDLLNQFPMNGEEFVVFSFQTPTRKTISLDLFVESIEAIKSSDNSMIKNYVLRCVTKDFLKNSYTLFSKRYRDLGYDASIATVLRVDLGSGKDLKLESTKGKFDYTVNSVHPFQVIDIIRERAVSAEGNKSSLFFFYEDNERYNFVTLEKLIEERKGKAGGYVFSYDTANRAGEFDKVINVRNILSYKTQNQGSSISKVRKGQMSNQVRQFDILTGTYFDKYEYINPNHQSAFKKTDDNIDFNSAPFNSEVTQKPAKSSMVVKDGTRPEMEHNKNIHWKGPFQEKISQYGVLIRVYGDTNILVGDMVRLNIPEITGTTEQPPIQDIYSNNYIIFSQRHMLTKRANDGRFSYTMALDLRKPNLHGRGIG